MSTEHELCEHGICPKCEPCDLCQAAKEGQQAAKRAMQEILRVAAQPDKGDKP